MLRDSITSITSINKGVKMSNTTNDLLMERAQVCLDYADNHPSEIHTSLSNAIQDGDLDEVLHFTSIIEGMMSQEAFAELGDEY